MRCSFLGVVLVKGLRLCGSGGYSGGGCVICIVGFVILFLCVGGNGMWLGIKRFGGLGGVLGVGGLGVVGVDMVFRVVRRARRFIVGFGVSLVCFWCICECDI